MLFQTTFRALPQKFSRPSISIIDKINPNVSNRRAISKLKENPHIYIHPSPTTPSQPYTLSLLSSTPPTPTLALGTCQLPLSPSTFTPNPQFLKHLSKTLSQYAHLDPQLQSQAAAFATASSHFSLSPSPSTTRSRGKSSGVPPSASQGGAGSGGHGGYIHLSDTRAPPDYGRIAFPEDIFGSLEVDSQGQFVEASESSGTSESKAPGNWQDSGTYRIVTRDGILGLTDFLREKVVEALKEEERRIQGEK